MIRKITKAFNEYFYVLLH